MNVYSDACLNPPRWVGLEQNGSAPENDPEAQASYAALRDAVKKFFNLIESKVKVEFVDGDPYTSSEQMQKEDKVV